MSRWYPRHTIRSLKYLGTAGAVLGASGLMYSLGTVNVLHADSSKDKNTFSAHDPYEEVAKNFRITRPRIVNESKGMQSPEILAQFGRRMPAPPGVGRIDATYVPLDISGSIGYAQEYFAYDAVAFPGRVWTFLGLYDGHNSQATASWLHQNLSVAVVGALADLYSKYEPGSQPPLHSEFGVLDFQSPGSLPQPPSAKIDECIKNTFLRVDDDIVNWAAERALATTSKFIGSRLLDMAHSASGALLSLYESDTRLLRVALTGKSRAVLGRPQVDGTYDVYPLTIDQDANNPAELKRLNGLHPGEKVVTSGRVFGVPGGPTRCFGNAVYKWSLELQQRLHNEYLSDAPLAEVTKPPYFTAEPEVTTTTIQPGDFLIIGSKGLWDCLTNDEAVGLVGLWLGSAEISDDRLFSRKDLPVDLKEDTTRAYRSWGLDKKFIDVDLNAATHLARNALGGAHRKWTDALLAMESSRAAKYREDISVIVVFFEEADVD